MRRMRQYKKKWSVAFLLDAGLIWRVPGLKDVCLCGGLEGYMVVIGRVPSLL